MRKVLRALLVLLTVMVVGQSAHALIPQAAGYIVQTYTVAQSWGATQAAACAKLAATQGANDAVYNYVVNQSSPQCLIDQKLKTTGAVQGQIYKGYSAQAACPANSTASGGQCACNSGYVQNAGATACELPSVTCNAGQTVNSGYYDAGTNIAGGPPAVTCQGGCTAVFDGTFPGGSAMVGGVKHYFAKGKYVNFGSKCDSGNGVGIAGGPGNAPAAVADVPPDSCGPGKVMGTVNDKPVCADAGNGTTTPTPNTPETSTDSKKEETTSNTTTNPDGSKTTTTTTTSTGVDGGKTIKTTTTVVNADGTPRSSTTTETGAEVKKEAEEQEREKCDKNAADEGCGGDPAEVEASGLYTKKEKTIASIFEGAKTTLQASPVGSATANFFTVSGGGSCPTATWNIPYLRTSVQMDAFCTPSALNMLLVIKGCLLLVASFMAFRIAVE